MGRIVSVTNQKGGVGKTTTSINLGASLGYLGYKVLLVDLDSQGNATSGVGVRKNIERKNSYEVLLGRIDPGEAIIELPFKNLFLIPSHRDMVGAEIELVSEEKNAYFLQSAISKIHTKFDFIFLDCPPSLGFVTLNSLTSADGVLITLQSEYFALEGLGELLGTIERVKQNFNPFLDIEGVLITMVDERTNLSIQVIEEVKKYFGKFVFKNFIPRSIRLAEAPSFGKPVIYYEIKSKGSIAYLNLAKEYIERRGYEKKSTWQGA